MPDPVDPRFSHASAPPQVSRLLLRVAADRNADVERLCRGLGASSLPTSPAISSSGTGPASWPGGFPSRRPTSHSARTLLLTPPRLAVTRRTRPVVYPLGRMGMAVDMAAVAPAASLRRGKHKRTHGVVIPTLGLH